jgi:Saccharopine dehydrogenase NADP binding domain
MTEPHRIAIYGATGHTGRQVVTELVRRGASPVLVGRDQGRLQAVIESLGYGEVRAASLNDPVALRRAFEGCAAVVNTAGPFADSAEPVARAAIDTSAHYLDVTAEQEVVLELLERWDAPARKGTVAVVPAMGFYGALGDLMSSVTARGLDCRRVTIAYAVDGWLLTSGSRATIPFMAGQRRVRRNGALSLETGSPRYSSFYFPGRGTEDVMEDYPLPEAITVPRHTPTDEVRLLMAAKTIQEVFSPSAADPNDVDDQARAGSRFLMVVEAEDGEDCRRTIASGRDIYGITAPIIVEGALRLIGGDVNGALAPSEAFQATDFLSSLTPEWLTLSPPWDPAESVPTTPPTALLSLRRAAEPWP